jgi:prepilin-type processing-associated H-X9-DG protein
MRTETEPEERGRRGFTLTELLVLIGVLALVLAVQLPALCRTKAPVNLARCLGNCRQIGQAALLYRNDYADNFPYGSRVTSGYQVTDQTGWPMLLLQYMGGYKQVQPQVYLCPSESGVADGWAFQLHYQANRMLLSDSNATDRAVSSAKVRNPARYWMVMEKGPWDFANVRPGGLANPGLAAWNVSPGNPQYRRHSGGMTAAAADGHAEWLRTPPYQPGRAAPSNFGELGDCSGSISLGVWRDDTSPWQIKLYCREQTAGW